MISGFEFSDQGLRISGLGLVFMDKDLGIRFSFRDQLRV